MSPTLLDFARTDFDTIETPAKRIVVWDSVQKGLGLRISPARAMTFIVKVRLGRGRYAEQRFVSLGQVGQLSVKNVRLEAQAVLARALTKSQPEPRPSVEFKDAVTIATLCDMWLEKAAHRRRGRGPLAGSLRKEKDVRNDKGRIEAHIKPLLRRVSANVPSTSLAAAKAQPTARSRCFRPSCRSRFARRSSNAIPCLGSSGRSATCANAS